MHKKYKLRSFWKKMRSKYKLSFFNENTLEEVWTFRLSRLGAFLFFCALVFVIFITATYLIAGTPLRTLLPGYLKSETRDLIIDNALRIDSLSNEIELKDAYLKNLTRILTGDIKIDSMQQIKDSLLSFPNDSFLSRSDITTEFVQEYAQEEKYMLNVLNHNIPTDGFIFYPPVKGSVMQKFDPQKGHFGIDILPANNTPVSATLEGTVISAHYTAENDYVIELQHNNNFISIYKYNGALLKSVGDKVQSGENIAMTHSAKKEDGDPRPMIEFQLWHMGIPLNPVDYIDF